MYMCYSMITSNSDIKYNGPNQKVSKGAKIRNRYNQVPHLTQDTNRKVTNSQLHHNREPRGQPFTSKKQDIRTSIFQNAMYSVMGKLNSENMSHL